MPLSFYGFSDDSFCVSGKVKKGKTALHIVHNRPRQKNNKENEDDVKVEAAHINPHDALLLFKQMLDQVHYLCDVSCSKLFSLPLSLYMCV